MQDITVAVGGGFRLDQAGLKALIASLPGLRLIPLDQESRPQVLVWIFQASAEGLPSVPSDVDLLLLVEDSELDSLPETVAGLFSRDEPPAALGVAIRQVAHGEQYLSPSLVPAILQKHESKSSATESRKSIIEALTDREREILELLARGLSNKAIAARLFLSVRTVEGHLATIYSRLGVHSRTEAMVAAARFR